MQQKRMYNQIRQVEVIFNQKSTSQQNGIEQIQQSSYIVDYNHIDINFDIKFTNDSDNNMCTVELYNLSDSTLSKMKPESDIRVKAGYEEFNGYIFIGKIDKIETNLSGNDRVTKFYCTPNAQAWNNAFINKSWSRGIKIEDVARQVINLSGWKIGQLSVGDGVYNGGKVFRKYARHCLEEIAKDTNSMLYFKNDTVYMYPKDYILKKKIVLAPGDGLLESPTKNINQKDNTETYKIKTALRYDYEEDVILVIQGSQFIEPVELKIKKGSHKATDTDFYTELECEKISTIKKNLQETAQK